MDMMGNEKNRLPERKRLKTTPLSRSDEVWGYIFILPQFLGIMVFTLLPAVAAIFISFTKWNFIEFPEWVGLYNFKNVFSDPVTWTVIRNTLFFIAGNLPLTLAIALGLSLLLNSALKGVVLFRTAVFMPSITSAVAVSLVWSWMFNPDMGLINAALSAIGIQGPGWIASVDWAMPAVIIVSVWQWSGYNAVILLAGLKAIPATYIEAAEIDGANVWQRFWYIKFPMLTPSIFFISTMMLINGLQVFSEPYMMTNGGPSDATNVIVLQIYRQAFQYFRMGDASVLSLVLFALCFGATVVQFKLQNRWVNYDV